MNTQEPGGNSVNTRDDFFTKNHGRLLDIAVAAKYVAWAVLIIYIISAILQVIRYDYDPNSGGWLTLRVLLTNSPFELLRFVINILATILRAIVYYLVLTGISFGLNMIIETDLNYREHEGGVSE